VSWGGGTIVSAKKLAAQQNASLTFRERPFRFGGLRVELLRREKSRRSRDYASLKLFGTKYPCALDATERPHQKTAASLSSGSTLGGRATLKNGAVTHTVDDVDAKRLSTGDQCSKFSFDIVQQGLGACQSEVDNEPAERGF